MRFQNVIPPISALLAASALAACGGGSSDNGVSSKSAQAIVSDAANAMDGLQTVHVAGSAATGATPVTLDLHLVNGKGGTGQVSENGLSFKVITVNQTVYVNAPTSVWQHFAGPAAAQLINGRWLKSSAAGQFAPFAKLTNLRSLFSSLLSSHGSLTKGSTTSVNGQKAIAVNDTSQGGTLYVATTGKPYALQISKSGSSGGQIRFDQFNQSVSISPPANSIDLSQLSGSG